VSEIYVMDVDSTNVEKLARGATGNKSLSWSRIGRASSTAAKARWEMRSAW
jgi:Tol biopolymer transport system component